MKQTNLQQLEVQLSDLAAQWRGNKGTAKEKTILAKYRKTLLDMIHLGFHSSLDADAELPNRLMPQEYLALFDQPKEKA